MAGWSKLIRPKEKEEDEDTLPHFEPDEPMIPDLFLSTNELPAVADWKVGEDYIVKIRQKTRNERTVEKEGEEKHNVVEARFEVIEAIPSPADDVEVDEE